MNSADKTILSEIFQISVELEKCLIFFLENKRCTDLP